MREAVTRRWLEDQLRGEPRPRARAALRASFHLRRYAPLYAFGTIWVLMAALLPSVNHGSAASVGMARGGRPGGVANADGTGGPADGSSGPGVGDGGSGGGGTPGPLGTSTFGGHGPRSAATTIGTVQVGTGTTRGGYVCAPGVRQIPWSLYAPPCVAKFAGGNGGATYRGVTADTVKIAFRVTADQGGATSQAQAQLDKAAGMGSSEEHEQYAEQLLPWFNSHFELYGRHAVVQRYNGQGNSIDEQQDKGQEAACADAATAARTLNAFGDVALGFYEEGAPFAECAAREGLYVPAAAANYPESWYQASDPYVWDTTNMECERIADEAADYVGTRLWARPARFAGDALTRTATRRLGVLVPNNAAYQSCANRFADRLRTGYGASVASRYDYAFDISQFATEANRAAIQFKADRVTTVVLACDYVSALFLTQAAHNQDWHPEWFLIGVGGTDSDGSARLFDQSEVAGHLFGMSASPDDFAAKDPGGEAARAWQDATGKPMPAGGASVYYTLADLFTHLQAAGPNLTPAAIAAGSRRLPPEGGPTAPYGTWSWAVSHAPIMDVREIYWDPNAVGVDGAKGHYVATYGGRRFAPGQWPAESPPIYPSG